MNQTTNLKVLMRKQSLMGSSRFEYDPEQLDKRASIRSDIYASAYSDMLAALESALDRADGDIVSRDNLEEWLGRKLVEEFIKRRGGSP
ncbi:hypothetical protein D3C74_310310 [compost metagenome]